MMEYDVVRIELNENKEYSTVFTRLKGDVKKIKVWFNGEKIFEFDRDKKEKGIDDLIKNEIPDDLR